MMKKKFTLFAIGLFISGTAFSQWCVPTATPTTMNSYSPTSPVITNVTFNTINRTTASSTKELYIYTGLGTTVEQGSSIPFSMSFTRDAPICPQHNLRVWIDWNLDQDFTDGGELALTLDNTIASIFTGTINVPATASLGTTRMRVAMKMIVSCGHTLPDPCVPPESFGWHGEIEDYDLTVIAPSGIEELGPAANINLFVNNTGIQLEYFLKMDSDVELNIYNTQGQNIRTLMEENQSSGKQRLLIDRAEFTSAGMYIATLVINKHVYTKKFVITE